MALKDALELVLSADTSKFNAAMQSAGATAERELGKADGSLQKVGGRLQVTGAAMVGFGAVVLGALGHTAQVFEEAELANLKLNNSIANSPKLAGESAAAFEDLATALMHKTVFDDEAIKSGESMLIQFGLTKDQVLGLTPLVADLADKMGVDLETAAKAVGKAVDGNAGALGKMGIQVDKTAFATDHYTAVQDALNQAVGGFAEQHGKSFEGQLAILHNNLQELEEGVGQGVVTAFQRMFGAVETVTGALESLSPGAQAGIGEWATYGATALIAVGALNMVVGTVLKAGETFGTLTGFITAHTAASAADAVATEADAAAQTEVAAAGMGTMGTLALVAGAAIALGVAYKYGSDNAETFTVNVESLTQASDAQMDSIIGVVKQGESWGISIHDQAAQIASESIPAAEKFAAALERNGVSADGARQAIDEAKRSLQDHSKAQAEAQAAAQGTTVELQNEQKTMDAAGKAAEGFAGFMSQLGQAMDRQYQSTVAVTKLNSQYQAGIDNLTKSISDNGFTLDLNTDKGRANTDAILGAGESIAKLIEKRFEETHSVDAATQAGAMYVANLQQQLQEAGLNDQQIAQMIQTMGLTPEQIKTTFSNNALEQQLVISKYQAQLDGLPDEVTTYLDSLINQGMYDQANSALNRLAEDRTATINVIVAGQYGQAPVGGYPHNGAGRNAAGTDYWRGGLTWVGEQGPELLNLPSGSQIMSNQRSMAMVAAGGPSVSVGQIVVQGAADPEATARAVRREILKLQQRNGSSGFN